MIAALVSTVKYLKLNFNLTLKHPNAAGRPETTKYILLAINSMHPYKIVSGYRKL